MVCVNASKTLQLQFKVDGLLQIFTCVNSMDEVRRLAGQPAENKPAMNADFVNPFIQAAQSALKVQANIESKPGKPYLKATEKFTYEVGIAGVISLISDSFTGSIALCFPSAVFLKIYENMVGEAAKEITPEIQDAAGELLNIIFGQAKTVLNDQKGHKINKAIPTVLVGDRLKIQSQNRGQTIVLPFETANGPFHVEVSLQAESSLKAA
jgi:chemotaxis protein CheX